MTEATSKEDLLVVRLEKQVRRLVLSAERARGQGNFKRADDLISEASDMLRQIEEMQERRLRE